MNRPTPAHPAPEDDHAWVRRRLAAAAAGLLADPEQERLLAHLDACADCARDWQEQMQALAGEDPDGENAGAAGERHLPPAMIARWGQAAGALRGAEREAVRRHLQRCADCRADLVAVGQRPELGEPAAPARLSGSRTNRGFGAGLAWGVGVTALAAAIAGALLLPQPTTVTSGVLPWVAPATLRGGASAVVDLEAGAASLTVLTAVPTDVDPTRPATVSILDPAGQVLLTSTVTPEMQTKRTVSILMRIRGGVPAGEYRVVFTQPAADGPPLERTSTFRVNLRGR